MSTRRRRNVLWVAAVSAAGLVFGAVSGQVDRAADSLREEPVDTAVHAPAGEPPEDVRDWSPALPLPAAGTTGMMSPAATAGRLRPVVGLWTNAAPVCVGSGTDGARVQVVYARETGSTDRLVNVESAIRSEISRIDSVFHTSAQKTGGGRRVRWVTNNCLPTIAKVVVPVGTFSSASGIDPTERAFARLGLAAKNRKYLVFADADRICGVSTIYKDSSATDNANDGRNPQYARIDSPCWNSPDWSVAAHELVHTLGGVQPDAPNALGRYHCDDANDLMCYRETPQTRLRTVCGTSHVGLLDCNNDDYFNTAPRKGTYLAGSWNVANSSFLAKT